MKNRAFVLVCIAILFSFGFWACDMGEKETNLNNLESANDHALSDSTLYLRYQTPINSERIPVSEGSFQSYLRNLPLRDEGETVKYYNGGLKPKSGVYDAVVDMSLGNRDLQQCADAVMRLRAEYLYSEKRYDEIQFNFLSDGKPRFYNDYHKGDLSYSKFLKYMDYIFSYANTSSLYHELSAVENKEDMKIGDVFIQKGSPYGHAIIVVDMAENKDSKQKYFILAQSYMPAQDTQILINPSDANLSPWYELKGDKLNTPEWGFNYSDLRRFN